MRHIIIARLGWTFNKARVPLGDSVDSTALQWTPRLKESLSAAELMWVDLIHCVINQTRFDLSLGDLDYVLRNMIAKMISSASHYNLSRRGFSEVQALNLDITAPIRIKKFIYGKSRATLLERHSIRLHRTPLRRSSFGIRRVGSGR